jgi:hypothetical protein
MKERASFTNAVVSTAPAPIRNPRRDCSIKKNQDCTRIWRTGDLLLPMRATSSCHCCRSKAGWRGRQALSGCNAFATIGTRVVNARTDEVFPAASSPKVPNTAKSRSVLGAKLRCISDLSNADHFRSPPDSSHFQRQSACLKGAKNRQASHDRFEIASFFNSWKPPCQAPRIWFRSSARGA